MRRKESLADDPEIKNTVTVNAVKVEETMEPMNQLIRYYSDLNTLKQSVAWIIKVKAALWKQKEKHKEALRTIKQAETDPEAHRLKLEQHMKKFKDIPGKKSLTLDDLDNAELEIIQFSQRQHLKEEIRVLRKGTQLSHSSALLKLDPILQDGTMRVGGRLNKSAMPETA